MSDSDSSSSSSSSGEEEKPALDETQIQSYEDKIALNPYNYTAHNELVILLHEGVDFDRCREARERMSQLFPLTPSMWLTWIKEERMFLAIDKDRVASTLRQLYSRAVKDYLSVHLWCQYCSDMVSIPLGSQDEIRKVFEEGLSAAGLHTTLGGALWEQYREYETTLFLVIKDKLYTDQADTVLQDMFNKQKSRVENLYQRQINVPLKGIEAVLREYKEWLTEYSSDVSQTLTNRMKLTLVKREKINTYEESIEHSAAPHDEEYRYYIDYERKCAEPARVTCLFERAITENPLNTVLWLDYLSYLDHMLNIKAVVLSCYSRAVRNIPWVIDVWTGYILAQQRHNLHFSHIDDSLDEALKNGFSDSTSYIKLWQCYLDCHWRHVRFGEKTHNGSTTEDQLILPLRAAFTRAVNFINQTYGEEGDPRGLLTRFMARVYGQRGDMDSCRLLMGALLQSKLYTSQSEVWLDYIDIEQRWGSIEKCRTLYQRAIQCSTDNPLLSDFIDFERFYGTLEHMDNALLKCKRQQKKLDTKLAKEAVTVTKKDSDKKNVRESDEKGKKKKKNDKEKKEKHIKSIKEEKDTHDINRKRKHSGGIDKSRYHLTVFVSNIHYEATEDHLNSIFKDIGSVVDIRLVRGLGGESRGYGYIEFHTRDEVMAALEIDRTNILGRPMYVSECLDKISGTPAPFKYESKLEPKKVFVSNLPLKYTEDEVKEMFSQHGDIISVRMVTTKAGFFKGFCYVEYMSEECARRAVLSLNGLEIGGRPMQVAISNPPKRGDKTIYLDHESVETKRKQKMSFLPRSTILNRQDTTQSMSQDTTQSTSQDTTQQSTSITERTDPPPKMLSNADFSQFYK